MLTAVYGRSRMSGSGASVGGCCQGSPGPYSYDWFGFFGLATVGRCRGVALAARSRLQWLEWSAVRAQILRPWLCARRATVRLFYARCGRPLSELWLGQSRLCMGRAHAEPELHVGGYSPHIRRCAVFDEISSNSRQLVTFLRAVYVFMYFFWRLGEHVFRIPVRRACIHVFRIPVGRAPAAQRRGKNMDTYSQRDIF